MLTLYTGRSRLLTGALVECLRTAGERTQLVVVPKQLTLQTERTLLSALNLRGSFRLQVLSAERLCGRIFDAAGQPEGARIDDRGRVMLVRAAVRAAAPNLTLYRGAEHRRGFPEKCAAQLERIRQAGVTAETLRACAAELSGSARLKLNDLSYILEAYDALVEGRYQDGTAEFLDAIRRTNDAAFLRECDVWFFGFDMMPPTLHGLIASVAAAANSAGLFLPLENDENARDFDAFLPILHALRQLCAAAKRCGAEARRVRVLEGRSPSAGESNPPDILTVPAPARRDDLRTLEEELFAFPAKPSGGPAKSVQMTLLRNPQEECRFAAALTRRLVRARGWRWSDVLILCKDLDGYAAPLRTAFAEYGVPLFLASSRSAARHATAECLLTALRALEKGFPAEDMLALMRTGLMPIDGDEADRLSNYAIKYNLRGTRFLRPLQRGSAAEVEALEPIRARLAEPLVRLRDRMRRASVLQDQLSALFAFLTDIDAYEKSQNRMQALSDAGLREAAGEEGQVWNRILGALDQMQALMGEEKLSLRELTETLTESLSASVIKSLPQSGDAVYAQPSDRACSQSARAILVLGASDRPVSGDEGLLTPSQKQALSSFAHAYLGPDDADLSRLRRFYLKSSLGMATDYVSLSCPLSGSDGAAQRPSAMFTMIEALFPGTKIRGGLTGDASVERMLRGAPGAAVAYAAAALAGEGEGVPALPSDRAALAGLKKIAANLPQAQDGLRRLSAALNRAQSSDALSPDVARALYGVLRRQSVTRLERFAACPFSYFAQYGLQPERIEPFELSARDEGSFFHSAVNEFLLRSMDDLGRMTAEQAGARMDAVTDLLLESMRESGPLGDSAVSMAERRRLQSTARVCAAVLSEHMRGSAFHPAALEQSFGREDGSRALTLGDGCVLEGRIDRIDEWLRGGEPWLRVIDYKRGGKALKLAEAWHGLRLQLPVYLAAAMKRRGGESAGVYYFTLDEGILSTQSADPNAVEAERRKAFRMEGLLPGDPEVLEAMSPNFSDVVKARVTASGELYKGTLTADAGDYRAVARCALKRAEAHLAKIQSGICEASPARFEQSNPCQWCDYRAICLFDDRLDAGRVRKFKNLPPDEVLLMMKQESGEES